MADKSETLSPACFRVGLSVSMELSGGITLRSTILGWETDRFLLVRLPAARDQKAGVSSGESCLVRFLMEDHAYGFETDVLRIQFQPSPLLFLRFPSSIEQVTFRTSRRFRTNIPGKLLDAERKVAARVVVQDFSEKGCLIRVEEPERSDFKVDTVYYLTLKLFQAEIQNLYCTIRNRHLQGDKLMLGTEFSRTTAEEKDTLQKFIVFLEGLLNMKPA